MNQREFDEEFSAIVRPYKRELAAKPIIFDEAMRHVSVRALARLFLNRPDQAQQSMAYAETRLANQYGLEADEVDHVIHMRMIEDYEEQQLFSLLEES